MHHGCQLLRNITSSPLHTLKNTAFTCSHIMLQGMNGLVSVKSVQSVAFFTCYLHGVQMPFSWLWMESGTITKDQDKIRLQLSNGLISLNSVLFDRAKVHWGYNFGKVALLQIGNLFNEGRSEHSIRIQISLTAQTNNEQHE
jgi:hypothetical protein